MAKIMGLLEELEVLEALRVKTEDAYYDDEENEEKEAEFVWGSCECRIRCIPSHVRRHC